MVVGSPGVGKSALLQMMRQEGQTRKNNRDEVSMNILYGSLTVLLTSCL